MAPNTVHSLGVQGDGHQCSFGGRLRSRLFVECGTVNDNACGPKTPLINYALATWMAVRRYIRGLEIDDVKLALEKMMLSSCNSLHHA